jgi:PAS domain S-box-containing protein
MIHNGGPTRMDTKTNLQERQFRLLVSSIKDYAIFMTDPGGYIISWNQGAEAIKGYKEGEIIGKHISIFYTEEEVKLGEPSLNLSMANQYGHYEREGWRRRKDGSLFWADVIFTALYDELGELTGYAKITRDITARKKEDDKFKGLLESAPDAMVIADNSGKIALLNKQAEFLFGYDKQELIGQPVEKLIPVSVRERHIKHRQNYSGEPRVRPMGAGLELFAVRKDGTLIPVEISLSPLDSTEGSLVIAAIRDVSERKKAEDKFRGLLESAPDAMIVTDHKGSIVLVNHQTEMLFHYKKEELIGKTVEILIPSDVREKHVGHRQRYFNSSNVRPMGAGLELFAVRKDGSKFPVEISLSPLITSEGKLVVAAIRDITEKKYNETLLNKFNEELTKQVAEKTSEIHENAEQLRQLSAHLQHIREEERESMAREIHDQLGQMLTGLKMDISWLLKEISPNNEIISYKFKSSLSLLDDIVKTVRRISTELHPGILDDLGLIAALEWQSNEFEKRSGIKVCFDSSEEAITVIASAAIGIFRIYQESLTNIARHAGANKVHVSLRIEDDHLKFIVSDNGKGFDTSVKSQNKSLGLIGMRERALMMDGKCQVSSELGKGTTIQLNVPVKSILIG